MYHQMKTESWLSLKKESNIYSTKADRDIQIKITIEIHATTDACYQQ